jgi:cystathionine beta-lyase/cystathionine gamma-synthase
MGIDMVVHSGTKYLNGHSDVVAGVVCGKHDHIMKMFAEEYMTLGGVISPNDAWLMLRGLRTLELRVNKSNSSASKISELLETHPKINKVHYPFSKNNPQLALAKKQMKQGGGMLSIELKANDVSQVEKFCDALKCFLIATSWGGYESLIFPMCALAQSKSFEDPLPFNLVRLYIGLEDEKSLIADLEQALSKI